MIKLDTTRIKYRWRERVRGAAFPVASDGPDQHTKLLIEHQTAENIHPSLRRIAYGGSNGALDAVIDAIVEELTRVIEDALNSQDPTALEALGTFIAFNALQRDRNNGGNHGGTEASSDDTRTDERPVEHSESLLGKQGP